MVCANGNMYYSNLFSQ